MDARLYVGPASHPSRTAMLMLEYKGIPYKRRDLIYIVSKGWLRAAGFPGVTVPALKLDGKRVQGSTGIARELDRVQAEPPLFPPDSERRTAVEKAESWGAEVLQPKARRILWACLKRDRSSIRSYLEGSRLGLPHGLATRTAAPIIALSARFNEATDERVEADLATLQDDLDRIEKWIAEGVLGGEQPNAADFQIATSLRALMTLDDLRPVIENRPAGRLAMRLVHEYPGNVSAVLPPDWLEPLQRAVRPS
ncbi:MAG: glutathione S-transferase family protein [Solirubrobacterales bacterium]